MPIHLPPLTRRRFLKVSAAAGLGALLPRRLAGAEPALDPNRVAFLSDTHIWENREKPFGGVKPAETFRRAAEEVLALSPRPAHLVISGDLAHLTGQPGDYAVLRELLEPLRRGGVTVHLVLGNHDNRAAVAAAFPDGIPGPKGPVPGRWVAVVETPRADLVLLDSLKRTNMTPGEMGEAQRSWLDRLLAEGDRPALVVAHHNPDRRPQKRSGLLDTEPFFEVLAARRRAKAYLFGHTHAWSLKKEGDLHLINVPTTAHLFSKREPRGWVDARLEADGVRLTLHALAADHPDHGKVHRLAWRA